MSAVGRSTVGEAARDDGLLADGALAVETDELKELLADAQERGFVTHEEIAAKLEEADFSEEQVRDLHSQLADHGVEVIAGEPPGDAGENKLDGGTSEGGRAAQGPALDLSVEPSL